MSDRRRERILKLGKIKFILLYGVCGWGLLTGLLFGLAMTLTFCLPAFLLLRWLGKPMGTPDLWSFFIFPLALSVGGFSIGGLQWGSAMWKVVSPSSQAPSSSSRT